MAALVCCSCEQTLLQAAIGEQLEIQTGSLPAGKLDESYYAKITAEVRNDPYDDQYTYSFQLREGELPAGLILVNQDNAAVIVGVPSESGEFTITVSAYSAELAEKLYGRGFLLFSEFSSDTRDYTLSVAP